MLSQPTKFDHKNHPVYLHNISITRKWTHISILIKEQITREQMFLVDLSKYNYFKIRRNIKTSAQHIYIHNILHISWCTLRRFLTYQHIYHIHGVLYEWLCCCSWLCFHQNEHCMKIKNDRVYDEQRVITPFIWWHIFVLHFIFLKHDINNISEAHLCSYAIRRILMEKQWHKR